MSLKNPTTKRDVILYNLLVSPIVLGIRAPIGLFLAGIMALGKFAELLHHILCDITFGWKRFPVDRDVEMEKIRQQILSALRHPNNRN